jgi:hypothetical protein
MSASKKIQQTIIDLVLNAIETEPEVESKKPELGGSPHKSTIAGAPCYNYTWDIFSLGKFLGRRRWANFRCKFNVCTESEGERCKIRAHSAIFSEKSVSIFGKIEEAEITPEITTIKDSRCPQGKKECVRYKIRVGVSASTPGLPSGIPYVGGLGSIPIFTKVKEAWIEISADGEMHYMDGSSPKLGTRSETLHNH